MTSRNGSCFCFNLYKVWHFYRWIAFIWLFPFLCLLEKVQKKVWLCWTLISGEKRERLVSIHQEPCNQNDSNKAIWYYHIPHATDRNFICNFRIFPSNVIYLFQTFNNPILYTMSNALQKDWQLFAKQINEKSSEDNRVCFRLPVLLLLSVPFCKTFDTAFFTVF